MIITDKKYLDLSLLNKMKISRNWLQTYFENKIPEANELSQIFTFHSFEVESQEKINRSGDIEEDDVLDIKVLPDRAHYALSHNGIALEIAVNTGLKQKNGYEDSMQSNSDAIVNVDVQDSTFCRRYIARHIKLGNMSQKSPIWLKNALNSIGQRSINTIVDITNFVMYDIGQPLHAFDADKIVGHITVRNAKVGEKIVLLDGREIELSPDDSVIADDKGALVVAGAKGGKRAEIDENTKNIIVESANFHPTRVRRTSTKYDIRSDSSKRFENEITPELAMHGMNNVCQLINNIIPGSSFGPITDIYSNPVSKTKITFDPKYIQDKLGVQIDPESIRKILGSLGMDCICQTSDSAESPLGASKEQQQCEVTVPYERLDISSKEDLVEEIGRIYGYDKIAGILPPLPENNRAGILPIFYISELIKSSLIDLGFSEVSLYSLVDEGHHEAVKPLAKDKAFVRSELTKGMISCIERNSLNADLLGLQAIKIFEIGHIFTQDKEKTHLIIGVNQIKKIKGYKAEDILNETIKKVEDVTRLKLEGKISTDKNGNIKVIEIDLDKIANNFKVDSNSFNIDKLNLGQASINKYKKFSLYPFIVRDIAIFVPESVASNSVWNKIETTLNDNGANELVIRHTLFDTFKKDGRISYAFRLIFQSMEKTLTDAEISVIMEKINAVIRDSGWEVR